MRQDLLSDVTFCNGAVQMSADTTARRNITTGIVNAFTVDLEDWYQGIELPFDQWPLYASRLDIGLERILALMDRSGVKATFFVLGWIAQRHPELVKKIDRHGHELGSHGFSHEKVYHQTPEVFRDDIRITRRCIQDITGRPVVAHRSPFFSITSTSLWALQVLAEEGITIDCSISPIKTWRYGIRGCPDDVFNITDVGIIEYPVSTFEIFKKRWAIGGAYFRILPYRLTRAAFQKRQEVGKSTMFYVHPWEYDPDHPRAPMEWKAKLTHYARLRKMLPYTESLLKEFKFNTVSEAVRDFSDKHAMGSITTADLKD
jgi:polysaccharide deacetylase family protein (PEP-CTERM system associated)